jgi:hypothetical protein
MVEWSLQHADWIDPLTDLKWAWNQFKGHSWFSEDKDLDQPSQQP